MTERRVLITGASSGFGLATAFHLTRLGFTVIGLVIDEQEEDALGRAAAEEGLEVGSIKADLANPQRRATAVKDLELYALVNNAGYMNAGLIRDVPVADARTQFEAMVLAPVDLARRVLPHMLERGEGRIVNVTSAAVHTSTPFTGWYQACKAALRELTDALRAELEDTGIDVVDIEPGGFQTDIWDRGIDELRRRQGQSSRADVYEEPLDLIHRTEPKMGDPNDVAEVIGRVLTQADPRAHIRVGPDAGPLRLVSELVPDRLWDRMVAKTSGIA
jgi:NAD(P)-dependent dehydrogenase (short-subunit alcohol dehydrogenase family)